MTTARELLCTAAGFILGALLGYGLGRLLGLDLLAPGYEAKSLIAIALVGLGGGAGLQAARLWLAGHDKDQRP